MKKPKHTKPRVYLVSDLAEIGIQLGCRVRLELVPLEILRPTPPPEAPSKSKKKPREAP